MIQDSEPLKITPLGAGSEVGRSCIILSYKGKNIMLDCGIHPAFSGLSALPFFDEIDPSTIDLVLITHFHLDHAASLPYFTERTTFRGQVFMTHPTKSIFKWLLADYVRVSASTSTEATSGQSDRLFSEQQLLSCYEKINAVDFHQTLEVSGVKFTAFNAGHVLGAAMFLIEIAGVRIFYTGDYSREPDRHLMQAELPPLPLDVLICESTYGVQAHMPRLERESRFTSLVHKVVSRGGRCLLPVFALGRAQELLLILDEYWEAHPELQQIPIYFASSLAKKCMPLYQTYINMMNDHIRRRFAHGNPFCFKHISTIKSVDQFDDSGPCVMFASPGMLQSGLSRELLELWCPNPKNGVIIAGYCVEGTLARQILAEPSEIVGMSGAKIPLRLDVEYISFSAHVDFPQNAAFMEALSPAHIVLVHGEQGEMSRLKSAMVHRFPQDGRTQIHTPRNCESVILGFRGEKYATVVGMIADSNAAEIEGLIVGKDFAYEIVEIDELREYTPLSVIRGIEQCVRFACGASLALLEWHIMQVFGRDQVTRGGGGGKTQQESGCTLVIMGGAVALRQESPGHWAMRWTGSILNDMIADAVAAVAVHAEISRTSVKMTLGGGGCCGSRAEAKKNESEAHDHDKSMQENTSFDHYQVIHKTEAIKKYLGQFYSLIPSTSDGDDQDHNLISVNVNGNQVDIKIDGYIVECEDSTSRELVQSRINQIKRVLG